METLRKIYTQAAEKDSIIFYAQLQIAYKDSVSNQKKQSEFQNLTFSQQLREIDEQTKAKEAAEEQRQNIQFALMAFGIISFIIIFLLLSRSFITNTRMIEFLGVIALLIVFEFLNLLLHPFLESITHHSPVLMLLALVCIAALLVPLHHKLEKWATTKLVEKNKLVRLAAAKKTIENQPAKPFSDGDSVIAIPKPTPTQIEFTKSTITGVPVESIKPSGIEEKYVARKKVFAAEIPVSGDSVELHFYDNGQVDGDSISLFLNDKLIFEHIRLTDKAYSIKLSVRELNSSNELIMVAENLGSIPPNTSYMVATVADKMYEARLESTEGSSAVVRLVKLTNER